MLKFLMKWLPWVNFAASIANFTVFIFGHHLFINLMAGCLCAFSASIGFYVNEIS